MRPQPSGADRPGRGATRLPAGRSSVPASRAPVGDRPLPSGMPGMRPARGVRSTDGHSATAQRSTQWRHPLDVRNFLPIRHMLLGGPSPSLEDCHDFTLNGRKSPQGGRRQTAPSGRALSYPLRQRLSHRLPGDQKCPGRHTAPVLDPMPRRHRGLRYVLGTCSALRAFMIRCRYCPTETPRNFKARGAKPQF